MARVDKLREEIGWLKVVFAILVAVDISLIGWFAQNLDGTPVAKQITCVLAVVVVTGAGIRVSRAAYAKIGELEDL